MENFETEIFDALGKDKEKLLEIFKNVLITESELYYRKEQKKQKPNAFKNSDLIKKLKIKETKGKGVYFEAEEYIIYLDKGRKKQARKPPIKVLIEYIKKHNLATGNKINNLAFAIQNSIYKKGIKGRKFIDKAMEAVMKEIGVQAEKTIDKKLNDLSK